MADAPVTLAGFFAPDVETFSRTPLPSETADAVKEDLGALDQPAMEAFAMTDLLCSLYHALEPPLQDVLRSAWAPLAELREYRDAEKHPPEETSNVRLGRHRIISKHHPKVAILLNEQEVASLTFDVQITLYVTAATLVVRAGRIWRARGCQFQAEAELTYRGLSLMKKKTEAFTPRGAVEFPDGILIPPLPRPAG